MVNKTSGFILIEIVLMLVIISVALPIISDISHHQKKQSIALENNYKKQIEEVNKIYEDLNNKKTSEINNIKLCKTEKIYYACQ